MSLEGAEHEVIIQSARGWMNLHEVWKYREFLYFFTWRDIKVRYKQMLIGGASAIIQRDHPALLYNSRLFFGHLRGYVAVDRGTGGQSGRRATITALGVHADELARPRAWAQGWRGAATSPRISGGFRPGQYGAGG